MSDAQLTALVRESLAHVAHAEQALKQAKERAVAVAIYVSTHRDGDPVDEPGVAPASSSCLGELTIRQREIMDMVLSGKASKIIAFDLGISRRTVENHRASIMRKTRSKSIPALARLAFGSV
jgi:FixJ family two-component response regulator